MIRFAPIPASSFRPFCHHGLWKGMHLLSLPDHPDVFNNVSECFDPYGSIMIVPDQSIATSKFMAFLHQKVRRHQGFLLYCTSMEIMLAFSFNCPDSLSSSTHPSFSSLLFLVITSISHRIPHDRSSDVSVHPW